MVVEASCDCGHTRPAMPRSETKVPAFDQFTSGSSVQTSQCLMGMYQSASQRSASGPHALVLPWNTIRPVIADNPVVAGSNVACERSARLSRFEHVVRRPTESLVQKRFGRTVLALDSWEEEARVYLLELRNAVEGGKVAASRGFSVCNGSQGKVRLASLPFLDYANQVGMRVDGLCGCENPSNALQELVNARGRSHGPCLRMHEERTFSDTRR